MSDSSKAIGVIDAHHPGHVGSLCTTGIFLVRLEAVDTKSLVHAAELHPSYEEFRGWQRSCEAADVCAVALQKGQLASSKELLIGSAYLHER